MKAFQLATLKTRRNLRRVTSRSSLWDRYDFSSFVLSLITVPQASFRLDSKAQMSLVHKIFPALGVGYMEGYMISRACRPLHDFPRLPLVT